MIGILFSRAVWKRLVLYSLFLIFAWGAIGFFLAYAMTRRPFAKFAEKVPEAEWNEVQEFRLKTADDQDLGAWFVQGKPNRPVVVILHGLGSCRTDFLREAKVPADDGCSVLLVSLRGHGDSTGDVIDFGYSAKYDVKAAVDWLEKEHPRLPIVVWGHSMGAAAAIFAAKEIGTKVKGYILECPYECLHVAAQHRLETHLPLPVAWFAYHGISTAAPCFLRDVDDISPLAHIGFIPARIPVLILAGSNDPQARPEEARKLYERIRSQSKLAIIESSGHGPMMVSNPDEMRSEISEFLRTGF